MQTHASSAKWFGCPVSRVAHSKPYLGEQMAHLAAMHSGHPGSWHRPRPGSPAWSLSWGSKGGRRSLELSGGNLCRRSQRAGAVPTHLKMVLVLAKLRMGPRTTSIPLSSEAFSLNRRESESGPLEMRKSLQTKDPEWRRYLQHHGVELLVLVQLPGTGQNGGGLSGSRRPVEQEVRKPVLSDEPLDWRDMETFRTLDTTESICFLKWTNLLVLRMSLCEIKSSSFCGLYFSTLKCKTNTFSTKTKTLFGRIFLFFPSF